MSQTGRNTPLVFPIVTLLSNRCDSNRYPIHHDDVRAAEEQNNMLTFTFKRET